MGIFSLPGLLRRILLCADFRSLVVGFSRRVLSLRGFGFSVVFGFPAVFGSLRGFRFFVVFGSPVSRVLSVRFSPCGFVQRSLSSSTSSVCVILLSVVFVSSWASFGLPLLRLGFWCFV